MPRPRLAPQRAGDAYVAPTTRYARSRHASPETPPPPRRGRQKHPPPHPPPPQRGGRKTSPLQRGVVRRDARDDRLLGALLEALASAADSSEELVEVDLER